jgi:sterol desaturase/sphingolipid hydroxylase (fatty acid hydroxylase superfamily)
METILTYVMEFISDFVDANSRLAFWYLPSTILLAAFVWWRKGRKTSLLAFLFPKEVYRHPSNLVDIKIFLINNILAVTGLVSVFAFTPAVVLHVIHLLSGVTGEAYSAPPISWSRSLVATVIMVLTLDFCKYVAHYIHHESPILWPFHALHHSAEIMTPLTAARNHPVFVLIRIVLQSLIVGVVQGVMLFLLIGKIDLLTIGAANAGYVLFNFFGSNLRHSHVWLSYGPFWEHILISPAQHHVHHSIERRHYNKNYGEIFAFWDWAFGTLYIPEKDEVIRFGLGDANGEPIPQPYPTLRSALVLPFFEAWAELKKSWAPDIVEDTRKVTPGPAE